MRSRRLAAVALAFAWRAGAEEAAPAVQPQAFAPAALEQARLSGRPLLLLVGDPSCARCRLDEADALADAAAARLVSGAFVAARADRLQRPDLDDLYGTAAEWLGADRAYPLFVALLPDGRPYAAAGGIAADDRGAQPGLHRFALRAWSLFAQERATAEASAARAAEALVRAQQVEPVPGADMAALAASALRGLERSEGAALGGFGEGEGFAPPATLRFLLGVLERGEDAAARRLLERTLDAVAAAEPDPPTLARRAVLLEAFARAALLSDRPAYRARAAALAEGAMALRDADGAFVAYAAAGGTAPVLAGWNGLMIGALALSGSALGRPADLEAARRAAEATLRRLGPPSRLRRSAAPETPAQLEDYAFLAEGLLRLYAASGNRERRWGDDAAALVEAAIGGAFDPAQGGFFDGTGAAFVPPALPARTRSGYDGTEPSANGVMAGVLLRLSRALSVPRYADLSRRTVEAFAGQMRRAPRGMEGLAAAALDLQPAPEAAAEAGPAPRASEAREGVRFTLEVDPPRGAGTFVLRLRMEVAPGTYVVAHDPGAPDLAGLAISIPSEGIGIAGAVRYPVPRRLQGRWDSGVVNVHDGTAVAEIPVRLRDAARVPDRVRLRAVFQSCRDRAARCGRADAVLLEAPLAPGGR